MKNKTIKIEKEITVGNIILEKGDLIKVVEGSVDPRAHHIVQEVQSYIENYDVVVVLEAVRRHLLDESYIVGYETTADLVQRAIESI